MKAEFSTEFFAEGIFPDSERFLLIGPKLYSFTTLVASGKPTRTEPYPSDYEWTGQIEVNNRDIKGEIVFLKNAEGKPFKSQQELLNYLVKKFHIRYLKDTSKPAVETG